MALCGAGPLVSGGEPIGGVRGGNLCQDMEVRITHLKRRHRGQGTCSESEGKLQDWDASCILNWVPTLPPHVLETRYICRTVQRRSPPGATAN